MNQIPKCNLRDWRDVGRLFLSELFGTALICFTVMQCAQPDTTFVQCILTVGFTFTWIGWICGPISGAQVNPSVTLILLFTRRLSIIHALVSICAQMVGSVLGALIGKSLLPVQLAQSDDLGLVIRNPNISVGQAVAAETIGTSIILLLVLSSADEFRATLWSHGLWIVFPIVLGITIMLVVSTLGRLSGGCFNTARAFGPAVIANKYTDFWIYVVGPLIAPIVCTVFYEMLLSDGASLTRLKIWFTSREFDRARDYKAMNSTIPE